MQIKNTICVVTGGTNGLGKATVDKLLDLGTMVIIFDIKSPDITNQTRLDYIKTDITNEENVIKSVEYVKNRYKRIDILLNCAGIGYTQEIIDHDTDKFIKIFQINCLGTFLCCKHIAKKMVENEDEERGVIINVASIAGVEGTSGQVAYSCSKGAILGMSMPLARDLSKYNIRVCTISPGPIDTGIKMASYAEKLKKLSLVKRFGYPEEFAKLVIHMIENQYFAGTPVRFDGGLVKPHMDSLL
tara:strand:+ start:517 stop:1248 length:732 start_codon:yes stop_codon:yes gene_type:complete